MSANRWVEPRSVPIGSLAESFYFGPEEGRLFGWLHRPRVKAKTDTGLLICRPFGYEAICSHRVARALAETAAAMGMPALRFDYSGTGDSAEIESEADQIAAWSRDVLTAIEELRQRGGVSRVCLLGFRLGGLLAALVANRCTAVDGLVLIAPVISGRRYLRELRTTRLASLLGADPSEPSGSVPPDDKRAQPKSFEVSGFSLTAASLAVLAKIDLMNEAPPACDTLIIDGASLPAARGWAEELSRQGRRAQYLALPGVVEMMITAPQYVVTSPPMVAATRKWLAQFVDESAQTQSGGSPGADTHPVAAETVLTLPGAGSSPGASLIERPVFFGAEAMLFGIVTEPGAGEIRRRAVILLNAGADHHMGPSRINVSVARRWARSGYFVLRMDLAGLGDSGTRPGSPDDQVFPSAALDDIGAGIELLRARYGIRDITLVGLCSGAYHALRAAVAGVPVGRILMVNPLNFFWKQGMMLDDLQVAEVITNPGRYRQRVFSGAAWKRLLRGRVNIWRIVNIYIQRSLLPLKAVLRDAARRLRIHLGNDLGWELEEIAARGVQIVFVFAHGEPGIDLLKIQGGSSVKRIGERCRVRVIERADHVFSHSGPRAALEEILSEELFARTEFGAPQRLAAERVQ